MKSKNEKFRRRPHTVAFCLLSFALSAEPAWSALYLCVDAAGVRVFTDSPSQLEGCTAVTTGPPGSPAPTPSQTVPVLESPGTEAGSALSPPPAPTGDVTVPIQRAGNLLVVQVQINGSREARLVLDTGASHTILSYAIARDLGILSEQRGTTVTLKTAAGQVQADMIRLHSIRVGDAEVQNSQAAIYDVPDAPAGVEGLLGLTFLHQFAVTLDVAKGQLHLRRRE